MGILDERIRKSGLVIAPMKKVWEILREQKIRRLHEICEFTGAGGYDAAGVVRVA
jgi:hypothetical protein